MGGQSRPVKPRSGRPFLVKGATINGFPCGLGLSKQATNRFFKHRKKKTRPGFLMADDTFGSGSLVKSVWHTRVLKASMPFPCQWLALVPPILFCFFCFSCIPLRMGYNWKRLRPPHFRIQVTQFRAFLMLLFLIPSFCSPVPPAT